MSLRTSLQKLIRRDAAGLHERADDLRGSLSRRTIVAGTVAAAVPLPALANSHQPERAEYRTRLMTAYAEDRARRPISDTAEFGSIEERAAELVGRRLWATAREVLALPPPSTIDGLALTALAASILTEADFHDNDPTTTAAVGLTRAVLALTGTPLLDGFVGFGDETDHEERDAALFAAPGSLPAWAIAQATKEHAA